MHMMVWVDNFSWNIVIRSSLLMCFYRENCLSPKQFVTIRLNSRRHIASNYVMLTEYYL
jgi:hypothetical protein